MSPTWPGGWGWAWTGWPAGTGSGSPCPGAAPASWRWRPGPAEEEECHQNMGVVIQYLDKMLLRRQSPSTANTSIADGGHGGCWESENYVRMMTRQGGSLYLFVKPYSQSPKTQYQSSYDQKKKTGSVWRTTTCQTLTHNSSVYLRAGPLLYRPRSWPYRYIEPRSSLPTCIITGIRTDTIIVKRSSWKTLKDHFCQNVLGKFTRREVSQLLAGCHGIKDHSSGPQTRHRHLKQNTLCLCKMFLSSVKNILCCQMFSSIKTSNTLFCVFWFSVFRVLCSMQFSLLLWQYKDHYSQNLKIPQITGFIA